MEGKTFPEKRSSFGPFAVAFERRWASILSQTQKEKKPGRVQILFVCPLVASKKPSPLVQPGTCVESVQILMQENEASEKLKITNHQQLEEKYIMKQGPQDLG
jgi:hypothetical protein